MANLPPIKSQPWMRHAGIGVNYAAAVAGFGLIGWWVDSRWDTRPWGVLIGVALGLIGATYNLVRESMAAFKNISQKDNDKDDKDNDESTKQP